MYLCNFALVMPLNIRKPCKVFILGEEKPASPTTTALLPQHVLGRRLPWGCRAPRSSADPRSRGDGQGSFSHRPRGKHSDEGTTNYRREHEPQLNPTHAPCRGQPATAGWRIRDSPRRAHSNPALQLELCTVTEVTFLISSWISVPIKHSLWQCLHMVLARAPCWGLHRAPLHVADCFHGGALLRENQNET